MKGYFSLYPLLFLIYAVSFTLTSTFFHHKTLTRKYKDDFKAYLLYFACFSLFFFIIPVLFIFIFSDYPFPALKSLGLQIGRWRTGLPIILIGLPIFALLSFSLSNDPKLREQYPFSREARQSPGKFILYEASYLFLYYVAWEFVFRGVFLFSLSEMMGFSRSGIVVAILVQATLAAVFHLGHPDLEIIGALVGSILFGIIAYITHSILYTIFLHALLGILNDTLITLRHHKKRWA